jgi:short-subunit dehydrogenase
VTGGDNDFAGRYGPWALVAGASEGVGAAFARAMAERGLNVVLLARRQAVLEEVAGAIRADTGVETRVAAVDLSGNDAVAQVVEATSGIDVGMLMYCAGADPNYEPFLDNPIEVALSMVTRNTAVPMALCHHFAGPMAARGRGGIVLVSSGAGLAGGPNMVAYAATKAFDIVMAEALWAELHDRGVDVLGLVLGVTDTPALRRILAKRGVRPDADDPAPIPGAVSAEDTVAEAIANLSKGPTWFVGEQMREGARQLGAMDRNDAVRLLVQNAGGIMDNRDTAEAAP